MKIRNNNLSKVLIGLVLCACTSCSDWTELEAEFEENLTEPNKTEEYYEALRAYKKSDHRVSFAWIGNISHGGVDLEKSYFGMPDSLDIVSIWGGVYSDKYWEELRWCQQKLGTKFLKCMFIGALPEEYGWTGPGKEGDPVWEAAVRAYANDICDEVEKNGLDGLDIDYEPGVGGTQATGNISMSKFSMEIWVKELGKRLGPQSGTGKLLTINGQIRNGNLRDLGSYFTYLIAQAYLKTTSRGLDSELEWAIDNYTKSTVAPLTKEECAKKLIVTENFEKLASTGGGNFTDREGNTMNSLKGMALYQPYYQNAPIEGIDRIAGFGAFHLEYEYNISGKSGHYPYMREAIQATNPAKHE